MKKSTADYWRRYWDKRGKDIDNPYVLAGWANNDSDFDFDLFDTLLTLTVERLALSLDDNFLDVGCGNGVFIEKLKNYAGQTTGIDFSCDMIRKAKGIDSINAIAGEAGALPFMDDAFTKVYSHGLFQYFPNKAYARQALHELYRVCKPGGRILIMSVPSFDEARWVRNRSFLRWKRYAYPVLLPIFKRLMRWKLIPTQIATRLLSNHYYDETFFYNTLGDRAANLEFFDGREIPENTWNMRFDVLIVLPPSKS